MDYKFIPLLKTTPAGSAYTIGHAMIWHPGEQLRIKLIVSEAAIERDFIDIPFSNSKAHQRPGIKAQPHPGYTVREAAEKFGGGLAYFNAGEMGMLNFPIIVDGKLITKPKPIKTLFQKRWEPLEGEFIFFIQYPDGKVEIQALQVANNHLNFNLPKGSWGFSAPYVFRDGGHVPLKNPPPGCSPNSQEVLFPGRETLAPISAIGIDQENKVIRISLVGDADHPRDVDRLPTEYDLVYYLNEFNVVNALYMGASGDVQYYDSQTQTLGIGSERPKKADSKWLLKEGQTERGLTVIAVLYSA